jgi:hypothetical protein
MRSLGLGLPGATRYRTPRRSGCFARAWCGPVPSLICSRVSTSIFPGLAIWPRVGRSSMRRSSRHTPKQRSSQEEKGAIKASDIPGAWQDKPAMLAQQDGDARWTVTYSKTKQPTETPTSAATRQHAIAIPMFGYKNHAGIDRAHGFIRGWAVTSATAHDGASSAMSRPRAIPPQPFGPTAPTAQRPMRSGWQRTP